MTNKKRVVCTGVGALSPLGHDWDSVRAHLQNGRSAVQRIAEWDEITGLNTRVGARVQAFELPRERYNRKTLRSMGRVASMACFATERALTQAGLLDDPLVRSGQMGISWGSCSGEPAAFADFALMIKDKNTEGINANTYIKMMAHTAPVNIGVFFGITGRIITTSSACTSGSQGIGYAFEAIQAGKQVAMVAGGSEELDASQAAVFDTLFATSTRHNDHPTVTPSPYDVNRDGLVLGEGACALILEEREHALARGAKVLFEVVGYGTNSDGAHVTQPKAETMAQAMRLALADAELDPAAIPYVNGHGTATEHGDIAETQATQAVFGSKVAISSLKSFMGHTLGACGALEAWMTAEMMAANWFTPTLNLHEVDPRCGDIDYLMGAGRAIDTEYVMTNNFAFGGVNTSLILRRA
ncbi:3-oxoacyl-[acyl-carrier-protein] synthase II [Inhella inkyongensis]|uniref:3-oxoacyl-[acyl-carrier-protein] synthase II n=1 Tax=Inhella inkyongensis TaxID=392593 RepID=A0A840S828_9BURK|nr:beta-ketoacyl-ACP synthase [Inhella inkyongensis]MBB5205772.1 3-oxoacyl-[acyl-carrier-protein] synthase II [Inhella inkyongensis]